MASLRKLSAAFSSCCSCSREPHKMATVGLRLEAKERHIVIDNGILQLTLTNPGGLITGIRYNGIDNLLEVINKEGNRGYWDLVWNEPQGSGIFDVIEGTHSELIYQDETQIEVSFTRKWEPSLQGKHVPLNIDKRFVVLCGCSGFYTYGIYEHLEGWPDFDMAETRVAFKLRKDKFQYMAIAGDRQRFMPMPEDRMPNRSQKLAYPEAVLLTNPINNELKAEVDDKYQYSCEDKDIKVHGWICFKPPVGFWQITPSNEFRTGGPVKQELTSHVGPTTLAMFMSAHYAGVDLVPKFRNGEYWKKVFGPVFIYLNSAMDDTDPRVLWEDAKLQAQTEMDSWPYQFPVSEDFQKSEQRGSVMGRLLVQDKFRQYGLWERYAELYPDSDLIYTIGVSDYTKDWFFAHVTRKAGDNCHQPTTWQIKFHLDTIDKTGMYKLRVALASATLSELQVRFNNPTLNRPHFTTKLIGRDNSIARHGIHGLYWLFHVDVHSSWLVAGDNTIYLTQTRCQSPFQGIMYDYIRMEGPPCQQNRVTH
ncbi:uncharacterized protein LOC122053383 isoform X2 [Zingiber officinale]|uniref:uncharacterized protein LOC122053383 isoform X2 n=1 Tax=Zingiber officinale TaxID=94328 RepID=UPI001C4B2A42|nr:uncharacterized protein LOC122053383 isoform X2 [Zingiber officinale]